MPGYALGATHASLPSGRSPPFGPVEAAPRGASALHRRVFSRLVRGGGVDGERMDPGLEFVSEGLVDHAMTSDPALSMERASHDIDSKMRFSARSMSGVSFMLMGLVEHLQAQWSEGFGQLP
jgi:hypothetical protein